MFYAVTDHDDKDRENPIVDIFTSRAEAEEFLPTLMGEDYQIEEWENLENHLGGPDEGWDWNDSGYACYKG